MYKLIARSKYLFGLTVLLALALSSGAGFKWGSKLILDFLEKLF